MHSSCALRGSVGRGDGSGVLNVHSARCNSTSCSSSSSRLASVEVSRQRVKAKGIKRRVRIVPKALGPGEAHHAFEGLKDSLILGLEPLYLPCSGMTCGDIVYRSTLDPVLRLEEGGPTLKALLLGGAVAAYLFASPGIFPGFIDYYFLAPLSILFRSKMSPESIQLGKVIGSGGFGKVFRGVLKEKDRDIVVKKAFEYGPAEAWMNERLQRACPSRIPNFLDAFEGPMEGSKDTLWLVWDYEGEDTLYDAMQSKDFPENLEEMCFGKKLKQSLDPTKKRATVIRYVMKEILQALKEMHSTGIVHRDVKPQNLLLLKDERKIKFIDFGAAADLRIGINYLPTEFLLDPRYAPPEKYIMSRSTPKAPPAPVAALLSPILWQLNKPDRFDMYSVGIIFVQMCFPNLRRDNNLAAFNRQLENLDYDIIRWRDEVGSKRGYEQGFEILSLDNNRGWDLLRCLISSQSGKRISAAAAVSHPFVSNFGLGQLAVMLETAGDMLPEPVQKEGSWLVDRVARSGTRDVGGLTEAMVEDMRTGQGSDPLPPPRSLKNMREEPPSQTINWWEGREGGRDPDRWMKFFSKQVSKTVKTIKGKSAKKKSSFLDLSGILGPSSSGSGSGSG